MDVVKSPCENKLLFMNKITFFYEFCCMDTFLSCRRYEEDMYWRRMEEEQMYWGEQRRRLVPPPLMSRPGMPVPPLLVSTAIAVILERLLSTQ